MNATSLPFDTLPLQQLVAYGFQPGVVARWVASGMDCLMPLQAQAVTESGLLRGANIVALAPTSAGKTFLGELAAVRHWQLGRKTVFLCPTRALVAEQFAHLQSRYDALGVRVVMATADHTHHDARIRRGDFDFAVMVYEKLRAFMVSAPDMIYSVGAVVADELQILGDPERGETADLLLTRLTRTERRVQVIGLSAVVDKAEGLAAWLDAELLKSNTRPSELREGVYCLEHGAYHYRSDSRQEWFDETLPGDPPASDQCAISRDAATAVVDLCVRLARAGENCLLFVPTRAMSRQLCTTIAGELGVQGAAAGEQWEELEMAEDSLSRRQLLESMPAGVAFHNSDLTMELRTMVERNFASGHIQVLVATPTLAQGVNLRSKNVLQIPLMLRSEPVKSSTQRPAQIPLSVDRYRNQAGRAGRMGSGEPFGRSIIVASGHLEAARLSRAYILAQPDALTRAFTDNSIDHFVLDCVHSGIADTYSGLHGALAHTFAWHSGAVCEGKDIDERLAESVRMLLEMEMLDETGGHRLRLTGLGQAMAAGGFRAHTIREMAQFCTDWQSQAPGDFEILCACAFTADGEQFPVMVSPAEIRMNLWLNAARDWQTQDGGRLVSAHLHKAMNPGGGLARVGHGALKLAAVSRGWLSDTETAELEERYRVVAGTMASMAAHLAWLAGGLASCASVLQCPDVVLQAIQQTARRLPQGLAREASRLSNLQVPGLSRNYVNRLAAEGFDTPASLRSASTAALNNVLPAFLAERVEEHLRSTDYHDQHEGEIGAANLSPVPKDPDTPEPESAPINHKDLLEAFEPHDDKEHDLILDRTDPGSVVFYGKSLRLSPKPYALLSLLAQRTGTTVSYTTIDEVVWPDEKVEPQQISAHKSRLIKELGSATSREQAEAAIVTDARFGLRLNLDPARVALRNRTKEAA